MNELTNAEIKLLVEILENPNENCNKIEIIKNPLLLHSILLNYDWEDDSRLIEYIINNKRTDVGTILTCIELMSDSRYVYKYFDGFIDLEVYEDSFKICDIAYINILENHYESHLYYFKPSLSKLEVMKFKKNNLEIFNKHSLLLQESGLIEPNVYYI